MEPFNLQFKPVEHELNALVALFPSTSEIALIHDAEEKLRVALHMWSSEEKDLATSLVVNACADLYRLVNSLVVTPEKPSGGR